MIARHTDEEAKLAAGRAAGYCWITHPSGKARCTRPPGHEGAHVDYYNGRRTPTDVAGTSWPL